MDDDEYHRLSDRVAQNFSIDDYLKHRDKFPDHDTYLPLFVANEGYVSMTGLDIAFKFEQQFKNLGISPEDFVGVLDGDEACIERLSLSCLRAISDREKQELDKPHIVANGQAISNSLLDMLICTMAEAISSFYLTPPSSWTVLLKVRLNAFSHSVLEKVLTSNRRSNAIGLFAANSEIKDALVAKIVGVNKSTVSRWKSDPDFIRCIEQSRKFSGISGDDHPLKLTNLLRPLRTEE